MAKEKKLTAEQKLLSMIEASSGGAAPSKTEEKVVKKQSMISLTNKLNKFLVVGIVVASLFLLGEISSGLRLLKKTVDVPLSQNFIRSSVNTATLMPVVQRLSFYLSAVKKRNIFEPYQEKAASSIDSVAKNKALASRIENLKLVGVSWMESIDTASVMIEDIQKKETYFLNKGEKIGDIIVKTIYADSAILGYENEEITIKYDKTQM